MRRIVIESGMAYSSNQHVHKLFEKQSKRAPNNIALVFEDQRLTYGELNARANQLARYLRTVGVGPDTIVGICVQRSLDMVIGILGIIKAGGAWLPLDPAYPKDRQSFMLKHARVPLLLTQRHVLAELPEHEAKVVLLDAHWPLISRQSKADLDNNTAPTNLAYLIYTSGTTGRPKGVMIPHANLVQYVHAIGEPLGVTGNDTYLHTATISFSSSVRQLMVPLSHGARVVIASAEQIQDPIALFNMIKREKVTIIDIVPSYLRNCIHALARLELGARTSLLDNHLRLILTASEPLLADLPRKWTSELKNPAALINMFGQTETTGIVTTYPIPSSDAEHEKIVPIGRPVTSTQVYVLDPEKRRVPIGAIGEICIGGATLARGYLHQPELTAEKFIPDCFSTEAGARLYRTGDLGRYLPDGNIEFVGRMDQQVKIRGFRVELSEIESVLNHHAAVEQAVVIAREDTPGDKRLVAYVVPKQEETPTISNLREFASTKLPDYMMPANFVFLHALPLTPTGKVNRAALPAPSQSRPDLKESFVAPPTPTEEMLAGIWAELLHVEQVGINDNFFDLGGHSLLATQLVSRLRETLGVDLPLRFPFDVPTVAGLAERIERARRSGQALSAAPIGRLSRDADRPLSFAQQRLWFLDQLMPGSIAYNITEAVRLTGPLNIVALQQSLTEILRRHEILRTTFRAGDGQPFQSTAPAKPFVIPVTDLEPLSEAEREAEARRLVTEETRRPFNLAKGPLFRATLLRLAKEHHILLYAMHHAVSDGWSIQIFNKEMGSLYQSFSNGQPSPLPELPIQYADFAVWQRQWLQGEVLEAHLCYWKKQLAGAPPSLELPTDRPRPAVQTFHGGRQSFILPKSLTEALKGLSRQEGVTLFMTLLAAFKVLLCRYTGQEDIVVGTPIAGRNRAEIEPLIGFFINTVALRGDLSGDPSFRELLRRVREVALGAYDHQELPFEKLVEELQLERDLSRTPLFQVFFNMLNLESQGPELCGLTAEPLLLFEPDSKFDLTFYATEKNEEIHLTLVYNADLFCQDRMIETQEQFRHLLCQIAENPDKKIGQLSLVSPASRSVLPDLGGVLPEPLHESVTGLFSSWARRRPDEPAVSHGKHTWSYGELGQQAESVARVLRARGVKRGEVVAVYGPRSFGLICSVMGVLLNGGALLLVDPNLPEQRKQLMLRQAGAKILLNIGSEEAQDAWLEREADLTILFVDAAKGLYFADKSLDLAMVVLPELAPDDPAYIFFTSGTTGVPKGVLGCHKGLSHFLHWQRETFAIGPQDRVAQLTNLSFDPVLRDILLPLSSGAVLCLPEGTDSLGSDEILRWLESERISVLHTVPTLAQSWLADGATEDCLKRMRCVFFAGEPLTEKLVRRWRATFPESGGEIVNLYGPTETTLAKCFYRVPADMPAGVQPVGCPLPETQALVLAENHQPCGIGEPGEIVLRTPFRTLGYINAPEENRQRFVKNPLRDDEKDLLYYTGDRGRYRPDGTLEILGRLDDQVKIHGVRTEPAEVTAILAQHPCVESCIVVGRKDKGTETVLVAYVVASKRGQPTSTNLRFYLLEHLPAAMVPSVFVLLDSLPLTANGKVDRKVLPAPDQRRSELEEGYVAPRTPVEEIIAEIWAEVLKLDTIGVHDNFFNLGGHSLLATQAMSRICQVFKMDVPLRALFERATVAELAKRIDEAHGEEQSLSTQLIVPVSRDKDPPLSFSQQRLWFLDQYEPNSSLYNIPSALRLRGSLNVEALEQSLNEIIRRHEGLRTTFSMVDGEAVQVIAPLVGLSLGVVDLRDRPEGEREEEARRLVNEEAGRPFDLAHGPLFQIKLLRLGEDDHVLLLTMHHIVSDGWSMGVLHRELSMLYQAFVNGQPSPLADLPIQYADFAVWQRELLQGEVLDRQLSYWKKQLKGIPAVLNLPTDHPRPAVQSHRGARQSFVLSKDLTEQLKALSRKEGVTPYMTLLAAFNAMLYQYTGQTDLVVGSPIAGRNRPEIEGLIGFFVNTLVLRGDLSGNPSFRELLKRVREVCLGAYAHQELPFQKVVEALQPKRERSRGSLAQVFFAFQNVPRQQLTIPGLTVIPVRTDLGNAKGALTLFMWQAEECLAGSLNYAADLFNEATISRMMEHFQTLLNTVVADSERRLLDLPQLLEHSRSELLEAIHWATEQSWHFEADATAGHDQGEI
jgi:amino acid adenylation domain-containing protein